MNVHTKAHVLDTNTEGETHTCIHVGTHAYMHECICRNALVINKVFTDILYVTKNSGPTPSPAGIATT